jgi:Tfp pilus assembly protein PilV
VLLRARNEDGFGLIELLMAMTMLNIGLLALVAAFNSGAVSLRRSAQISTASALADNQIESYRGTTWTSIYLDTTLQGTALNDTTYACNDALKVDTTVACGSGNRQAEVTATCATITASCTPIQTPVIGPDNRKYRVDTYIVLVYPTGSSTSSRQVKLVTVVVRDFTDTTRVLATETSTFDKSAG